MVLNDEERQHWKSALSRVVKRAERNDYESLTDTFVELEDLSIRMSSDENQILFGRRGTGKSHAFHHLQDSVRAQGSTAILVDLRTVGSAGGYYLSADGGRSLAGLHIIVDLLASLHSDIFELSLQLMEERDVTQLVQAMDRFATATAEVTIDGQSSRSQKSTQSDSDSTKISLTVSSRPSLAASASSTDSTSLADSYSKEGVERPALNLGQLTKAFSDLVAELPEGRLWLLLDEWSALPLDVQPIVADFLRRCVLPVRGVVVKIAAVERRSRFWAKGESGYVGLELGSDIGTGLDLDEYLARGLKSSNLEFYRRMVSSHIRDVVARPRFANDPDDRLGKEATLTSVFPAFSGAVYFAAGVPRDLLAIAGLAAGHSRYGKNIEFLNVTDASRQFFLQEKEAQARVTRDTRALSSALREYAEQGNMRFLVGRDYSQESEALLELLDQRIIHLLDRAIGPRGKFDLFAIDLGMVADVLSEEKTLPDGRNPWSNWDHGKTSQKSALVLHLSGHRITWSSVS